MSMAGKLGKIEKLLSENLARQRRQPEGVVEFTIGKQTGVGRDPRSVELKLQTAVEIGPK